MKNEVEQLIRMSHSGNPDVRRAAVDALVVCAQRIDNQKRKEDDNDSNDDVHSDSGSQ